MLKQWIPGPLAGGRAWGRGCVSLHISIITQDGESALMMAVRRWGGTEVVPLLLEAGANTDLQNKVHVSQCTHANGLEGDIT